MISYSRVAGAGAPVAWAGSVGDNARSKQTSQRMWVD
jgi:hypothetical protein